MDKWIIIHPTHLLPSPFMTQPAHLPPLVIINEIYCITGLLKYLQYNILELVIYNKVFFPYEYI